jgi:general secretion pathway protein D
VRILYSWRQIAAILCTLALIAPPMDAHTRKGDKLLKEGQKAEDAQDYDRALTFYEQALEEDAHEPAYLLAVSRVRNKSGEVHITQGRKLLEQQKLDAALVQFQKALMTDPSSAVALQMVIQTDEMLKQKAKAPDGTVILTPAERKQHEMEARINSLEGPPVLRPINNRISNLKFNNQTSRVIYESIGKLAGINVLFDPSGIDTLGSTTRNFNLDLNDSTLEEALQYVALLTHTFWKPISRNAIFVTQESEPKRQEYQDEVVKVFYVQNASTANEFTEIFNGVRIGAKLSTGLFQVASQNAIIARGTPDTMALVEKLVHDLDRPKAEVLVDVRVWEVSKSKTSTLGAALQGNLLSMTPGTTTTSTTGGTGGTTPTTTTTGSSIIASQIGKLSINNFSLALPSALAQAIASDGNTRLLDNPQIRVTDGGKGSLKVGQKIPYVSGSLNSAVATPGSIPYATTQFQQIDVGVNIDVQPHVNGPNDVSMHIKVEISNVVNQENIAGVTQPVIGQKINEADVRMKDGEYSLLGGLTSDSDQNTMGGLPGFSAVPVLGYFFGARVKDREKDDIIIALVPHIIRAQPVDEQLAEGVLAGTEKMVRVEHKQEPAAAPAPAVPATPARPGTQTTTPQLPPPGGQADLLPPTNNPRMPIGSGTTANSTPVRPMISRPGPAQQIVGQALATSAPATQAPITTVPATVQPPGTEVTPLEGMQQMGLTPDLVVTATPEGGTDNSANAPASPGPGQGTVSNGNASSPVSAIQETEPSPARIVPVVIVPEPVAAPATANPDHASYATIGSDSKPVAKKVSAQAASKAPAAAVAKDKSTNVVVKVQLASGTKSASASATAAAKPTEPSQKQPAASTAAAPAAAKQSPPVQLLEGHLTQESDSSTTTTTTNPKKQQQ